MLSRIDRLARSTIAKSFVPWSRNRNKLSSMGKGSPNYGATQPNDNFKPMKGQQDLNVDELQARMRATHESGVNLSYEWRMKQIRTLLRLVVENTDQIRSALSRDLGREGIEAVVVETKPLEADIQFTMSNLKKWMRPQAVPSPIVVSPASSFVERRPLNSPGVLIIGPFNYPVRLLLQPLLGALAGGNPAVVKPSENCPNVASLMKKLLDEYYDPGVVQTVLGGVPETTALLEKRWGKVFFTGSEKVGKIVAKACAETMTPTIMELGGKCPVVVDETVPESAIPTVAKRVVFAKGVNAGQTCIAPDILFVHTKHLTALQTNVAKELRAQFGENPKKGELARIVDRPSTERLIELIRDAEKLGAMIATGGSKACDVAQKFISPTFVIDPPKSARILKEEIFGPVMAIVPFSTREDAIDLVKQLPGEPLHLYIFTPDHSVFRTYSEQCIAAGALQNDIILQGATNHLPFGGIGTSGHGNYYGRYSFDSFTHVYPIMVRTLRKVPIVESLRVHPYAGSKGNILDKIVFLLPDVPVLHTRKLVVAVTLGAMLWAVPEAQIFVKESLIRLLEIAITILRR